MNDNYGDATRLKPGARIELHPGCDLWMQGAKYGDVLRVEADHAIIRMDNGQQVRVPFERLRVVS